MKAKIFNSVDITEVPAKIQEMLDSVGETLKKICKMNATSCHVLNLDMDKSKNVECAVEAITTTKILLAEADQALTDSLDLVSGYRSYVKNKEEEAAKKELLSKALEDQQRQAKIPVKIKDTGTPQSPDAPITKEILEKLAELSNANEG